MPLTFVTASVVFLRGRELLTVRKRGTQRFMLVGGKLEPGETPLEAAVRESREEVGAEVAADELTWLGHWSAPAANEPGAVVVSDAFVCRSAIDPHPAREIEECRWTALDGGRPDDLAPLLTECVIPALQAADGAAPSAPA